MTGFRRRKKRVFTAVAFAALLAFLVALPLADPAGPPGRGEARAEPFSRSKEASPVAAASLPGPVQGPAAAVTADGTGSGTAVPPAADPSRVGDTAPLPDGGETGEVGEKEGKEGAPPTRGGEEPGDRGDERDETPDGAEISAVDPDLPAPSDLVVEYRWGWWYRNILSWNGVSHPGFLRYSIFKWDGGDYGVMHEVFSRLAEMEPSAGPYVEDLDYRASLLQQEGWTYAERQSILEEAETDLDALFAILVTTPGTGQLINQLAEAAERVNTGNTYYTDWGISYDQYYFYLVIAVYQGGSTSMPSNCEVVYTVYVDTAPPDRPQGFRAVSYDPGVSLEWDRNGEEDLAGYNVYVVDGGTPVKLNQDLISVGTSYFHMEGETGALYQVEAVDLSGRAGPRAQAEAVLAPAVVYQENDPAWLTSGFWKTEDYTLDGGSVILVARDAGVTATLTFTGRRVKVVAARYWSCGDLRILVDGVERGVCRLYSPDTVWEEGVFVVTGLSPGQHTLTLEVVGSGGMEGYSFANFDYVEVR